MQENCHRCGGELAGDTQFCPHCGAPQLTLALEQQSVEAGGQPPEGAATTGATPPPMPRTVDWRVAIRFAVGVALVGAALSLPAVKVDALSLPSLLWLMSASTITLGLYQKRLPAARIDAGIGARIGVVSGLCLGVGLAIALAGFGSVERFALHGMGSFDAQLADQIKHAQQLRDQWLATHSLPASPEVEALEGTPEYRAGYELFKFALGIAALIVVSAMGGAFGGLLRARRAR